MLPFNSKFFDQLDSFAKQHVMKNGIFWDVTPFGSSKNRHFKGTWCLQHLVVFLRSVCRLLVTASVVPSSPILVTLMKEALSSSETSILIRVTWRNIPEDAILHNMLCLLKTEK
jgi:hypothetical protein